MERDLIIISRFDRVLSGQETPELSLSSVEDMVRDTQHLLSTEDIKNFICHEVVKRLLGSEYKGITRIALIGVLEEWAKGTRVVPSSPEPMLVMLIGSMFLSLTEDGVVVPGRRFPILAWESAVADSLVIFLNKVSCREALYSFIKFRSP